MSASACDHCGPVVCNWLHIIRNLEVKLCPRIMQAHVFYQGLKLFPHIRIYANAINDVTVPYLTAYVDLEDPFINQWQPYHGSCHGWPCSVSQLSMICRSLIVNHSGREYDDKYFPIIKSFTIQDTPTPKHGPHPYSLAWFRSYKPPLPPHLQAPFPFNIVRVCGDPSNESFTDSICTVLTPILLPIILILVLIRISISSYHSRSRIRLLESEDASATRRLVHVFGQLERRVEDIVANMADDPATPAPSPNGNQAAKLWEFAGTSSARCLAIHDEEWTQVHVFCNLSQHANDARREPDH
ncbi:hypothetical protein EDB85DRAFT_2155517 [Lactarius pseudohatsudake]|nr:hypothetical protein EDB85DRAFT_2155517 [Lactarius pseudohatsudake]